MDKNGKWVTYLNEEPKEDVDLHLIPPMEIRGYKVIMLDLNISTVDKLMKGAIYGIKKI